MRISDVSSDVCSSDLTSNGTFQLHSIQVGALAFTPGNNKQDGVREGDRPYASLLYVANGRSYVRDAGRTVYHTSLSVGLLGTQIVPEFQDAFHSAIGATKPTRWEHHISDSGEPSIRLPFTSQDLAPPGYAVGYTHYEIKHTSADRVRHMTE